MARLPEPPDGDRFYARLLAAVLECPRCGWLGSFRYTQLTRHQVSARIKAGTSLDGPAGWDPLTSSWRCGQCKASFVLGILAWPVARGGGGNARPRDQVPNERQLAQMRARGKGLWMPQAVIKARAEHTNVTAACCCVWPRMGTLPWTGEPEAIDPACPIHATVEGGESPPA